MRSCIIFKRAHLFPRLSRSNKTQHRDRFLVSNRGLEIGSFTDKLSLDRIWNAVITLFWTKLRGLERYLHGLIIVP
jgi:hypothetical protein